MKDHHRRLFLKPHSTWTRRRVHHLRCYWNSSILHYRNIVRKTSIFDQTFTHTGEDLGFYTPHQTQFKFWAPISQMWPFISKTSGLSDESYRNGVWELVLKGDQRSCLTLMSRVNGLERGFMIPMLYPLNPGDSLVIDWKKITRPIRRATRQLGPNS